MSQLPQDDEADATRAAWRYQIMSGVRLIAIVGVVTGIAIAQGAIAAPYPIGVALAVVGVLAFFFGPPVLAKRWKASDRAEAEDSEHLGDQSGE